MIISYIGIRSFLFLLVCVCVCRGGGGDGVDGGRQSIIQNKNHLAIAMVCVVLT